MNDRYYVFSDGRKRGPFSLDDLLDETERGQVEYEDLCLRIGATTCEKIREVLDWEDEHLILTSGQQDDNALPEAEADTLELDDADDTDEMEISEEEKTDHDDDDTCDIEDDDEEYDDESLQDEDNRLDENDDSALKELPPEEIEESDYLEADDDSDDLSESVESPSSSHDRPPQDSSTVLYSGRPSLLSYPKSLLLVALSLGTGIWLREQFDWILFAGIAIALISIVQAQLRRSRHQYYITPKQVEVIHGLILENSREVRIEDIGAIHIRQRGLQGLLGLATIEFAAAESPMPILVFHNVRAVRRIKDLVRRLQDALEYPE